MLFDCQDKETGKTFKLNRADISQIQTITAETLKMERGQLKENTNNQRLEATEYKQVQRAKEVELLKKKAQTLTNSLSEKQEDLKKLKEDLKSVKELSKKNTKTSFLARLNPKTARERKQLNEQFYSQINEFKKVRKSYENKKEELKYMKMKCQNLNTELEQLPMKLNEKKQEYEQKFNLSSGLKPTEKEIKTFNEQSKIERERVINSHRLSQKRNRGMGIGF